MQITITLARLEELGACEKAVQAVREFIGDKDALTADWTPETQLEFMRGPLRHWLGWALEKKLIPWWRMDGSNLSRSNLSGSNLSGSNLSGSNLSGSNLSGSNLSWSNLSGSNLSRSNLSGSNLSGSNLSWSNLSWSNLSWSDLSGSDLSGSNLSWSDLSGSNLSGARVCLCESRPCVALRDLLRDVGWIVGKDGLLEKVQAQEEVKPDAVAKRE